MFHNNKIEFDNAILKLQENTGIKIQKLNLQPTNEDYIPDMKLELNVDGNKAIFWVECKTQLRNDKLPQLLKLRKKHKNLMVITDKFYPNIVETLKQNDIAYLDTTGAAYIKADGIRIIRDGDKNINIPIFKKEDLTPAGVRFVFYLLNDDIFIHKTYREMAEICNTALGNVNKIIDHLRKGRYLLKLQKGLKVNNKQKLFEYWVEQYPKILKPKLFIGKFRFINAEGFDEWKKLKLQKNTYWGGEPAAQLITNYLKPAILTLYTNLEKVDLIKKYRFVPDEENAYLEVYRTFWNAQDNNYHTTPYILVYADLINTTDTRNIETAQMVYDRYIKEKL